MSEQLAPELRELLAHAAEWDELAKAVLAELGGAGVPVHLGVKALLLARVANDLRATVLLARVGYSMQSWATASSAFEMAHDIGFIGTSDDRAGRWVNHAEISQRHWPVYDAVVASFKQLELDANLVPTEYQQYRYLCLAKHGNPVIQAGHNLVDNGATVTLRIDPYMSAKVAKQLRLGLALAMGAMSYATWMVAQQHVENRVLLRKIVDAAGRTRDRLRGYEQLDDLALTEAPEPDAV